MPTIDVAITAGSDDASEQSSTAVSLTASPLLNVDGSGEWNAWKFRGITIPAGATIDVAYLTVRMNSGTLDEPLVLIDADDSASPADFAASNTNISGRTGTTASVQWSNANAGTSDVNTSSLVSIIQELVDSHAPYSSGTIVIRMKIDPSNDGTRDTSIISYEGSTTACARLHIEYTEAGQTAPAVVLDTADDSTFNDSTPTLEFTGTDDEADDIRYNIQITDNPDAWASGVELEDNYFTGSGANVHPNGMNELAWNGEWQVDDRPGQSFTGNGGFLDKIEMRIGSDDTDTDGYAIIRVYAHQGTFGTSSEPLNAADPEDTPTPGWLAESDPNYYTTAIGSVDWRTFNFTGANRIRLEEGVNYIFILDWQPSTGVYENSILTSGDGSTLSHPGNTYMDGRSDANNGVWTTIDMFFRVYEEYILLDKVSGTDAGFVNVDNGGDSDPFTSADQVSYTVQAGDALADGNYYWRVRGIDPDGSASYGDWTTARSFEIDTNPGAIAGYTEGEATASGSLTGIGALAGSAAGVGSPLAALIGTGALAGAIAGEAAASADLAGVGALAGSSAGVGSGSAALAGTGALAGAIAGVATVSGTLQQPSGGMAGSSAGVATAAGILAGSGALAGAIAGQAATEGTLAGDGLLSGAISGSGTAAGTLAGTGALAGSSVGTATVSGALQQPPGTLIGVCAGTATVSGLLAGLGALDGSGAGAGQAEGVLAGLGGLAGTSDGFAAVLAVLIGSGALAGSAAGVASVAGRLVQPYEILTTGMFIMVPKAIHKDMVVP